MDVEEIYHAEPDGGEGLLALVLRGSYHGVPGVKFHTPPESSIQVGTLRHLAGVEVAAHSHHPQPRLVQDTQEVLIIRYGKVVVSFFSSDGKFAASSTLATGDAVVLMRGGHGLTILEDCEITEVKQGPYQEDKRFIPRAAEVPGWRQPT